MHLNRELNLNPYTKFLFLTVMVILESHGYIGRVDTFTAYTLVTAMIKSYQYWLGRLLYKVTLNVLK